MRNACRKDDQRNGIRQCANMLCGRWEDFPREFAKCRRCRKAKYCGKECQSKAWAEGHRFWCSAREEDDGATVVARAQRELPNAPTAVATEVEVPTRRGLTTTVTRALVNIAGGMTGRTTPANTPPAAPTPARAGGGATVPDLMIHANIRPQQQQQQQPTMQGVARTGIIQTALNGPPSAGMAGRGAGMRVVRPLALPAGARPTPNWTGARGPIFADAQPQPSTNAPDAGPSRRARLPETARRRSGLFRLVGRVLILDERGNSKLEDILGQGGELFHRQQERERGMERRGGSFLCSEYRLRRVRHILPHCIRGERWMTRGMIWFLGRSHRVNEGEGERGIVSIMK